ncbi:MAG: hypothetical protein ACRD1B_07875 [Thermoanaerobaculia bacterium]
MTTLQQRLLHSVLAFSLILGNWLEAPQELEGSIPVPAHPSP